MTFFLLGFAAGALAFMIGKAWAIAIPLALGAIVGAIVLTVGGSLDDTPLPFVTAVATIAAGSAILVRRRVMPI